MGAASAEGELGSTVDNESETPGTDKSCAAATKTGGAGMGGPSSRRGAGQAQHAPDARSTRRGGSEWGVAFDSQEACESAFMYADLGGLQAQYKMHP